MAFLLQPRETEDVVSAAVGRKSSGGIFPPDVIIGRRARVLEADRQAEAILKGHFVRFHAPAEAIELGQTKALIAGSSQPSTVRDL